MAMTVHVDIVSAESEIFSGLAEMVVAPAELGDIGICQCRCAEHQRIVYPHAAVVADPKWSAAIWRLGHVVVDGDECRHRNAVHVDLDGSVVETESNEQELASRIVGARGANRSVRARSPYLKLQHTAVDGGESNEIAGIDHPFPQGDRRYRRGKLREQMHVEDERPEQQ